MQTHITRITHTHTQHEKRKKSLELWSGGHDRKANTEAGKAIVSDRTRAKGGSEQSGICVGRCLFVMFILHLSRDDEEEDSQPRGVQTSGGELWSGELSIYK